MFKTFESTYMYDSSWTGGGISYPKDCLEKLDKQINDFCYKNNLTVKSVNYSMVNENKQIGISAANTQRNIIILAGVFFIKNQ